MVSIPSHAKKVFSGVIFDVFQWDQEMFDGRIETFEAVRRPYTALILPVIDNKIVLSYEQQPGKDWYMSFLGGRLSSWEDSLQWAKRELEEEAGIVSDNITLLASFSPGFKIDYTIYYYIAKNCFVHGRQSLDAGWEKLELRYLTFDEFVAYVQSEQCRDVDLANYVFRLEKKWQLDILRNALFS